MHPLPHCVYVLLSEKDKKHYIGYTMDLAARLVAHNEGKNTSTAPRRPLVLIYCEFHTSEIDAKRREQYLKTPAGRKAISLMLRDALPTFRER